MFILSFLPDSLCVDYNPFPQSESVIMIYYIQMTGVSKYLVCVCREHKYVL
jgi:hypothetical protein